MADGETQEFELLNFLTRVVKKVDWAGRGCQTVLSQRDSENVRFLSDFKDIFQVFDQLMILSRSEEREHECSPIVSSPSSLLNQRSHGVSCSSHSRSHI